VESNFALTFSISGKFGKELKATTIKMECPQRPSHIENVAHDEKSKFFIFLPGIAYGKLRNVEGLFSLNSF